MKPQLKNKIEHQHQGKYQHLLGHHVILSNHRKQGGNFHWGNCPPWKVQCQCKIIAVHEQGEDVIVKVVILEVDKSFPNDVFKYQENQKNDPPDLEIGDVITCSLNQCRFLNPESI